VDGGIRIVKRVTITGANGFIGKNLSSYLTSKGFEVSKFDISLGDFGLPDISGEDAVIHLAANPLTTEKNLKKILSQNFEYSKKLYKLCETNEVTFQYASSASVYGSSNNFNESDFCKPLSPYSFSKYMFDCWLLNQNYPYQGFRYFNVYGLGEEKKGNQASPISKFIKQARENKEIILFENSENYKRDFVSVDDVCAIHHKMLSSEATGIYNIGTGIAISFKEVAQIIKNKFNCQIKEIPMPQELEGQYQKFTQADNTKLLKVVGEHKWESINEYLFKIANYL